MNSQMKQDALMQAQIASTLAAGIVAAMGRPVSMNEVQGVVRDVNMFMFPQKGSSAYSAWEKSFDADKRYE